ncbi:MAG: hypothetical protein ACK4PH_24695, partial [Aquincola tertiaricarbonis]
LQTPTLIGCNFLKNCGPCRSLLISFAVISEDSDYDVLFKSLSTAGSFDPPRLPTAAASFETTAL